MKGLITDKTRILHIIEAIGEVEKYLKGVAYDFAVNFHIVWEIAQNDLPVLKQQFQEALLSFPE